jgi:hypothetical protein
MANELNIALTTGLTVTAQPYAAGAASGSPISLSEVGTTGFYTGNMTGSTGTYQLVFLASGATVGTGQIVWDGTAEVASSAPSVVQIRQEMDANSTKLANLDATVSSRLAPSGTLATVTTLTNAPTVPTAAAIADEVRVELATELGRIDAPVSSASAPTASTVATAVRSELATELAHLDADISTRATPADIPASDISSIKSTTDALNTDRLAQVSTVATTGSQLAAALS